MCPICIRNSKDLSRSHLPRACPLLLSIAWSLPIAQAKPLPTSPTMVSQQGLSCTPSRSARAWQCLVPSASVTTGAASHHGQRLIALLFVYHRASQQHLPSSHRDASTSTGSLLLLVYHVLNISHQTSHTSHHTAILEACSSRHPKSCRDQCRARDDALVRKMRHCCTV
jgi:hypothetical protein